jgi:hypothetical protein
MAAYGRALRTGRTEELRHRWSPLAVDHGVAPAASDFRSNGSVRQLLRCGHLLISAGFDGVL